MNEFLTQVNEFSTLSGDASEELLSCIWTKTYKKGEIVNAIEKVCRHLFFVKSGLVKHYYIHKGTQFVLRFFVENQFFIVSDSFFNNLPAEHTTVALENTVVMHLEYLDFERLCKKLHSFETFARKFLSAVSYISILNIKRLLYLDAKDRYEMFLKDYGHLQQRISLGDTAGYLGISQVSLSRIRSKK